MRHLHIVPGAVLADPFAARSTVRRFGADRLEDGFYVRPGFRVPAGHHRGPVAGAFLAAGNAGSNVQDPFLGKILCSSDRVCKKRIAAVDNDVAFFQVRKKLADKFIHSRSRLDHQHDPPRALQHGGHLFQGMGADNVCSLCRALQEFVDFRNRPVVSNNLESMIIHVQDKILTHYSQSNQSNISVVRHTQFLSSNLKRL